MKKTRNWLPSYLLEKTVPEELRRTIRVHISLSGEDAYRTRLALEAVRESTHQALTEAELIRGLVLDGLERLVRSMPEDVRARAEERLLGRAEGQEEGGAAPAPAAHQTGAL